MLRHRIAVAKRYALARKRYQRQKFRSSRSRKVSEAAFPTDKLGARNELREKEKERQRETETSGILANAKSNFCTCKKKNKKSAMHR